MINNQESQTRQKLRSKWARTMRHLNFSKAVGQSLEGCGCRATYQRLWSLARGALLVVLSGVPLE